MPEGTLSDKTVQVLKSYQFISVREATAKQILEQNGIKGVEMVCDPTLLLKKEDWEKSIAQIKPITKEKYAFVYLLGNSKTMREEIRKKIQSENLKIVAMPHIHFSYQKRDRDFADIEAYDVGPFGLTGAEAMACGCALVSTNYKGVYEYARDKENALLSPINDAEALARNIKKLIKNEDLRQKIAKQGSNDLSYFSWKNAIDKFEGLIVQEGNVG